VFSRIHFLEIAMPFEKRAAVDELTEKINGSAFRVQNHLGCGFLEKVYENALRVELVAAGLKVATQVPCRVLYGGAVVGEYVADLVVDDAVIVEIKACDGLNNVHKAQAINYLAASNLNVALLLNFGKPRLEVRRLVRKSHLAAPAGTG
jgi:GxxExxY protein